MCIIGRYIRIRNISKLRKEIQSDRYFIRRIGDCADSCEFWYKYYAAQCDPIIVGKENSYVNTLIYNKYGERAFKKFNWYKKKINISNI